MDAGIILPCCRNDIVYLYVVGCTTCPISYFNYNLFYSSHPQQQLSHTNHLPFKFLWMEIRLVETRLVSVELHVAMQQLFGSLSAVTMAAVTHINYIRSSLLHSSTFPFHMPQPLHTHRTSPFEIFMWYTALTDSADFQVI